MTFRCETDYMWLPAFGEDEKNWPNGLRIFLYVLGLFYCFLGVAVVSDVFMNAIERITSQKKRVKLKSTGKIVTQTVWNDTMANLTLMALGSSAPEILLSVIEIMTNEMYIGDLGSGTVVGSAAFNLLVISAVCVCAIPDGEVRYIKDTQVYGVTATFSILAYVWLLLILMVISPDICELWEAVVTFLLFPVLLMIAFAADKGYFSPGGDEAPKQDENFHGAIPPDVTKEELAEIEQSIREEYNHKISDDQLVRVIQHMYIGKPSRAFYRHAAMEGIVGGKKADFGAHSVPVNFVSAPHNTADELSKGKLVEVGFEREKYAFLELLAMADDFFGCDIDLDDLDEVLKYDEEQETHEEATCLFNDVQNRYVCFRQTSPLVTPHLRSHVLDCQAAAVADAGVSRQAAMAIASRLEVRVLACSSLQQLGIGVSGTPRAHWNSAVDARRETSKARRQFTISWWEVYTSKQVVLINAPPLQVPMKMMQVLATFGGIFWLGWNMKFLQKETLHSPVIIREMSFPQRNFYKCHDVDMDCDDLNQTSARPYCTLSQLEAAKDALSKYFFTDSPRHHNYSKSRWPTLPKLITGCGIYDMHDVFRKSSKNVMLATAFTRTRQRQCKDEHCIWQNDGFEVTFVEDVERFFLKLRHVVKLSEGGTLRNADSTGFLQANNEIRLLACEPHKKKLGACGYSGGSHARIAPCGDMTGDEACFTTGFADFLSLRTLLNAANISLDEAITQNVSRRWWGTHLSIDIRYSNADPWTYWNFWRPEFLKLIPTYTYSVRRSGDYAWYSHHNTTGAHRKLTRMSGITMQFHLHGSMYSGSVMHFLKTLAIFTIIWEITMVVVARVMLFIYRRVQCLSLAHLPHLRLYFRQMTTPHHRIVAGLSYEALAKELQDLRQEAARGHLKTTVQAAPGFVREPDFFVEIIDDAAYEEDEEFYLDLSHPKLDGMEHPQDVKVRVRPGLGTVTVVIVDDDEPGKLRFQHEQVEVKEREEETTLRIIVERYNGATGAIECRYYTEDNSAIAGYDYVEAKGALYFDHTVQTATIEITIKPKGRYENTSSFNVYLVEPSGGASFDRSTDGGSTSCICNVVIKADDERKAALDRIASQINWNKHALGYSNWKEQFRDAVFMSRDDDEEEEGGHSCMDMVIHFVGMPWKLLFAFIPPVDYCNGWCCFFVALGMIAVLTAVVGDLANLVGCTLNIGPEITAITFVALGTSLPDTFASKTAAIMDPYADASIGNVTGSNSVNVFLGLGMPWTIGAIYWQTQSTSGATFATWLSNLQETGKYFEIRQSIVNYNNLESAVFVTPAGSLWFNLLVFSCNAICAIMLLYLRRRTFGGELGGPRRWQLASAAFLVFQWCVYIGASSAWVVLETE
ncbi:Slc8a2 [Symbiodinium sp. CCMP2592]|nr:Slc8a2 [Symbiodinium sp. CCMP2592]